VCVCVGVWASKWAQNESERVFSSPISGVWGRVTERISKGRLSLLREERQRGHDLDSSDVGDAAAFPKTESALSHGGSHAGRRARTGWPACRFRSPGNALFFSLALRARCASLASPPPLGSRRRRRTWRTGRCAPSRSLARVYAWPRKHARDDEARASGQTNWRWSSGPWEMSPQPSRQLGHARITHGSIEGGEFFRGRRRALLPVVARLLRAGGHVLVGMVAAIRQPAHVGFRLLMATKRICALARSPTCSRRDEEPKTLPAQRQAERLLTSTRMASYQWPMDAMDARYALHSPQWTAAVEAIPVRDVQLSEADPSLISFFGLGDRPRSASSLVK